MWLCCFQPDLVIEGVMDPLSLLCSQTLVTFVVKEFTEEATIFTRWHSCYLLALTAKLAPSRCEIH